MEIIKKYIVLLSAALLMLLIIACDNKDNDDNNYDVFLPEVIFETQIIEALYFTATNDNIVLIGQPNSYDIITNNILMYVFDKKGNLKNQAIIEITPTYINAAYVDNQGDIWLHDGMNIMHFNQNGKMIKIIELDVTNIIDTFPIVANNKLVVKENYIYLFSSLIPDNNSPLFIFKIDGEIDNVFSLYNNKVIKDLYCMDNEQIVLKTYNPSNDSYSFDLFTTNEQVTSWNLNANNIIDGYNHVQFSQGFDNILLKHTDVGLSCYDIENETNTPLIKWLDCDIYTAVKGYAVILDNKTIYTLTRNTNNKETIDIYKVNIINEASGTTPVSTRVTLYAAGFFLFDEIKEQVSNFNKQNTMYKIELKDYYEGDFDDSLQKFNLDIIAGIIPDIILLNDLLPIPRKSYADKGLFVNLYELIENDSDINKDDYLPNVLDCLEIDGKLYFGATSFYVSTLIGKSSVFGTDNGITWDEFKALMIKQPSEVIPFAACNGDVISRETALRSLIISKSSDFINTKTGTCDFINSDFFELLEFVGYFDENAVGPFAATDFRNGNPLLMQVNMFNFYELRKWEKIIYNEDITFVGFPSSDDKTSGTSAMLYNTFAISAQSANIEGAWEFAKYLLVDCQKNAGTVEKLPDGSYQFGVNGFPIKIEDLYRLANESRIYSEDTKLGFEYEGDIETGSTYNTDKEIDKIINLIFSITEFTKNEDNYLFIISEEVDSYFAGIKNAQQVAEVIQDRVSTLLSESR